MNTADDLLRRALDSLDGDFPGVIEKLKRDISAYLDAPKDEPVYLARRKGLDDFFTCSKYRYEELSVLDLFETKLAYLHPPTKTAPDLYKALAHLEPYLDAIVCYASTIEEHPPNGFILETKAALSKARGEG